MAGDLLLTNEEMSSTQDELDHLARRNSHLEGQVLELVRRNTNLERQVTELCVQFSMMTRIMETVLQGLSGKN